MTGNAEMEIGVIAMATPAGTTVIEDPEISLRTESVALKVVAREVGGLEVDERMNDETAEIETRMTAAGVEVERKTGIEKKTKRRIKTKTRTKKRTKTRTKT